MQVSNIASLNYLSSVFSCDLFLFKKERNRFRDILHRYEQTVENEGKEKGSCVYP